MIVEALIASVTIITLASMKYAASADEKEYEPNDKAKIHPYKPYGENPHTQCIMCGDKAASMKDNMSKPLGVFIPLRCLDDDCPAKDSLHVHCHCASCDSRWLMAPKLSVKS